MKTLIIGFFFVLLYKLIPMKENAAVRYVALGDSYTIGTGTTEDKSWPMLLTKHLKNNKIDIKLVANPSHNGWTTKDVLERELPIFESSNPTFATLLIGVNDWVQGVTKEQFQKKISLIIERVQNKLPDKSKLVLITIPDFGVTKTGKLFSNGRDISKGVAEYNEVIMSEAKKKNLKTADLFIQSKQMEKDASLVSADGLHPSAKGYAVWESLIYPVVYSVLK